jgi:hypothetical protein
MNNIYIYLPRSIIEKLSEIIYFLICVSLSEIELLLCVNVAANRSILDLNINIFKMDAVIIKLDRKYW